MVRMIKMGIKHQTPKKNNRCLKYNGKQNTKPDMSCSLRESSWFFSVSSCSRARLQLVRKLFPCVPKHRSDIDSWFASRFRARFPARPRGSVWNPPLKCSVCTGAPHCKGLAEGAGEHFWRQAPNKNSCGDANRQQTAWAKLSLEEENF